MKKRRNVKIQSARDKTETIKLTTRLYDFKEKAGREKA